MNKESNEERINNLYALLAHHSIIVYETGDVHTINEHSLADDMTSTQFALIEKLLELGESEKILKARIDNEIAERDYVGHLRRCSSGNRERSFLIESIMETVKQLTE